MTNVRIGGASWGRAAREWAPTLIASASLLLALGYLLKDRQYPLVVNGQRGAGLYPMLIGIFWAAGSAACVWEALRDRSRDAPAGVPLDWPDGAGWLRTAVVLASCAAYVALIGELGDLLASFLVLVVVMRAMGMREPVRLLLIAAVVATVAHLVFVTALNVPMPRGVLDLG